MAKRGQGDGQALFSSGSDQTILQVDHLVKEFPAPHGQVVHAVNDISFKVRRGEALGLVGESGSGKTTVGRCVLRLIEPTRGTIRFRSQDITRIPQGQLQRLRSGMQLVFQEPFDSLNPRMRVAHSIAEPLLMTAEVSAKQRSDRVRELLGMVGLGKRYANLYPHQLSGGEQQRVGIARAIATSPDLVVLDEPTSALDVSVRAEILNLLRDLQRDLGIAYVFISHDLTAVRRVCQRVAIMYLGRLVEEGETEALFARPLHPYSRALLSSVLYPNPRQERSKFLLSAEIPSPINLPTGCPLHPRCPIAIAECKTIVPPYEEKKPERPVSCLRVNHEMAIGQEPLPEPRPDAGAPASEPNPALRPGATRTPESPGGL